MDINYRGPDEVVIVAEIDNDFDVLVQAAHGLEGRMGIVCRWLKRQEGVPIRKMDMDDLVMSFLLAEGQLEAAERFQQEVGVQFMDASTMEKLTNIRDCLLGGQASEAINRVREWKPEILESGIYFDLIQQAVFDLLSSKNTPAALEFAQESLTAMMEKDVRNQALAEGTMILFLFEDVEQGFYSKQLSDRKNIAKNLMGHLLASVGRDKDSKLQMFLTMLANIQSKAWWCPMVDLRWCPTGLVR